MRLDAALAALLAAAIGVDVALSVPPDPAMPWALGVALTAIPLAWRRALPLASVAGVWSFFAGWLVGFGDPDVVTTLAPVLVAAYTAGGLGGGRAVLGGAVLLVGSAIIALVPADGSPTELVFVCVLQVLPWLGGRLARRQRERAEQLRALTLALEAELRRHEQLELAAERNRIAAELNDAVAHAVGAMTMQANAAQAALATDPARARGALAEVQRAGREAIAELHRMLGLLREPA